MTKNIAFISAPNLENFMIPVANGLEKLGHHTRIVASGDDREIVNAIMASEIVWIEWGNELAMHLTTDAGILNQRSVILRIHSYEAFLPYIKYINWERVDHLIFVAQHIKDIVLDTVPKIRKMVENIHVIPNGVDVGAIPFIEKEHGFNLAYVGYLNFKKGPMLLLQAIEALVRRNSRYILHIAGKFQEPRYELYFKQFIAENMLQNNVIFDGWVEDIPTWLQDKQYIVSTSVLESQGMGIMEAMAAGCKPLIHRFVGAGNIYLNENLWSTVDDFVNMVVDDDINSVRYRQFIDAYYSIGKELDSLEVIIESCDSKEQIHTDTAELDNVEPATLTVAMIVKDEEKNLARCLESVAEFADQIVIVDTGSNDKTMEIAREYTDLIYEHPWENFSVGRNQSIDHSTKDWILQIDADEEFMGDGDILKKALTAVSPNCDAMCLWMDDLDEAGEVAVSSHPVRIFKNGKVHFEGSVHNEAMFDKRKVAFLKDGKLNHYGYHGDEELKKKKSARTIGLLEKELIDNPARTKVLFYLFQSYCDIGNLKKGLDFGEQYLGKRDESHDFNESIYFSMISAYLAQGNIGRAKQILDEGLMVIPNDIDLATAMVELGVAMNDGAAVIAGANKYDLAYNYLLIAPESTGTRFTYSFKPESAAYIQHRAAMCHFENGIKHIKNMREVTAGIDKKTAEAVRGELKNNLTTLGLTIED